MYYFIRYYIMTVEGHSERTRVIERDTPIEYEDDIFEIQKELAEVQDVSKRSIMLIDWKQLKGRTKD